MLWEVEGEKDEQNNTGASLLHLYKTKDRAAKGPRAFQPVAASMWPEPLMPAPLLSPLGVLRVFVVLPHASEISRGR